MYHKTDKITSENLKEIIELRKEGWTLKEISEKFGVNHSSVIYWLKKTGHTEKFSRPEKEPEKEPQMILNKPNKTYSDYLKESEKRNREKLLDLAVDLI